MQRPQISHATLLLLWQRSTSTGPPRQRARLLVALPAVTVKYFKFQEMFSKSSKRCTRTEMLQRIQAVTTERNTHWNAVKRT